MIYRVSAILALVLVFYLGGFASLTLAQSYDFDVSQVRWSSLSFKSSNVFGAATSKVKLEGVAASSAEQLLVTPPQGVVLKPSGPQVFTLKVNTAIDPLIGSKDFSETKVLFNSEQAAALQRIRVRTGGEKWEKTYRWTEEGVYRLRKKPDSSDEENLPRERWKNIEESFYPYDLNSMGCSFVSEPSLLLYIASAANLSTGDQPLSLCVFGKKQVHRVQINAEAGHKVEVDYVEKLSLNNTRKESMIDAMKLSIKTRPLIERQEEAEKFSFLKLVGDFDIYVEEKTKIPVLIKGKTAKFGDIDIKLQEVELKPFLPVIPTT